MADLETPAVSGKTIIKFLRADGIYVSGDIAGFDLETAQAFVRRGSASTDLTVAVSPDAVAAAEAQVVAQQTEALAEKDRMIADLQAQLAAKSDAAQKPAAKGAASAGAPPAQGQTV